MIIKTFEVGPIKACCYIVIDEKTREAMIIDPGGDGEFICEQVRELDAKPIYIVNTHGHVDHMAANAEVRERFPDTKICIHEADAEMLSDARKNLSPFMGQEITSPAADILLRDGDELRIGENAFKVLHIPGHSPGSACLYCEKPQGAGPGVVFSGDTLFASGIGRTDFPDLKYSEREKFEMLTGGIREKIFSLPKDTTVYPGHGPATTVGREESSNPFFSN